jgi:uncharacterized membrane-anchored protein YhcB (DUF1043 family)
VNVKTGRTPGIRTQLQTVMQSNAQFQAMAMQSGMAGVLVGPAEIYRGQVEWLKMAGISNPERFWIDPDSDPAKQAQAGQAEAQQAQQQMQQQLMQMQLQLEGQRVEIERMKAEAAAANDQAQIALGYYEVDQKLAQSEAETAAKGVIDLEKQRMTNETSLATARISGAESRVATDRGRNR